MFVNIPYLEGVLALAESFLKKLSNKIPAVILLLADVVSLLNRGSTLEVGVKRPVLWLLRNNYF